MFLMWIAFFTKQSAPKTLKIKKKLLSSISHGPNAKGE